MHDHKNGFEIPAGSTRSTIVAKNDSKVNARFVATLSDGTTAVEESGEWTTNFGERKPWVRLTQFAAKNGLHLTSLRLNIDGRTIHMPRDKFAQFSVEGEAPDYYSLSYHLEVDDAMSGGHSQTHFVDLAAHFGDDAVHYIQDITLGNKAWIVFSKGDKPLAPSPRRK